MKTNNSYLKHQMKILAQSEGVTVEAREKAYKYVEHYISKLMNEAEGTAAALAESRKIISEQAEQLAEVKKECAKLHAAVDTFENGAAKPKTPVKKKTAAKKTVKK